MHSSNTTSTGKTCTKCSTNFEVTDADVKFYDDISPVFKDKKYQIPMPTQCPNCRRQRRLQFRNFFNLYHRTCDLTGKKILSMYDKDVPFPVYEMHEWWSDKWDELSHGLEPDLTTSVMDQIEILHQNVPRMSIMNTQSENTDYCNFSFQSKNCYLVFGDVENESCYYGHIVWQSKDCVDCLYTYKSELCYDCTDCVGCYRIAFSQSCENCSDSRFLINCSNCKNCFGCTGLKQKSYCMFNEQLTKEEYEKRMKEFSSGSYSMVQIAKERLQKLQGKEVVKYYHGIQCEDVSGDYLYNCKNVYESYDTKNCEDSKFLATTESFAHCYDCNFFPSRTEWSYEGLTLNGYHLLFCHNCLNNSRDLLYCDSCYASQHCFGCIGLKNRKYCIFNMQYSQEEYEELVPKLIELMIQNGEWGEFFPEKLSPFAYNETIAQEYFPKTQEELGEAWKEADQSEEQYLGPNFELPDNVSDVTADVCQRILRCEASGKPYKIIPQELELCKELSVPLPRSRFIERQKRRMKERNPRTLWDRTCDRCTEPMRTTYAPERPEKVYCEECYLDKVY